MGHDLSIAVMDKVIKNRGSKESRMGHDLSITNMDKVTEIVDQDKTEWAIF